MSTEVYVPRPRVQSLDAYRGLVMLLMMVEVLRLSEMGKVFPDSGWWKFISFHTSHVQWRGGSLHDLIQPSFTFLVGVVLPYSLASRLARGQTIAWMTLHATWRALLLVLLGIFLRSIDKPRTYFTFEDTLSQIGLAYVPLFLFGLCSRRWQWATILAILLGYWLAFALYPLPPQDFRYRAVGVSNNWQHHFEGFAAHWNKNSNLAWAFDTWFLNLFPRTKTFVYNYGGYATLSFIPTLGTMLLGLIAGSWLHDAGPANQKIKRFVAAGVLCLVFGLAADQLSICPSVKRIWTPSWVLISGGWCFLLLAAFYSVIDVLGFTAWSFPLRVVGANSIAAYVMAHPFEHFVVNVLHTHVGREPFRILGTKYEQLLTGCAVVVVYWLILLWMYRKKIFIRI